MVLVSIVAIDPDANSTIGVLEPYTCLVHEKKNGDYSLTMTLSMDDVLCDTDVIIGVTVKKNNLRQYFRIYDVYRNMDGNKEVLARHVFYDLLNNFLDDVRPTNATGQEALQKMLASTQFETDFVGESDITTVSTAYWQMKNPVEALIGDDENSFVNRWGGVLERDNWKIKMNQETSEKMYVIYGKDLLSYGMRINTENVVTRIMPTGLKEDGQTLLKLPELYVDSENIGNYETPKIRRIHYPEIKIGEAEGNYPTAEEAYTALRAEANKEFANGIDLPEISGDVTVLDLSSTEEYKDVKDLQKIEPFQKLEVVVFGGTVTCEVTGYDFNVLTQQYENISIGTAEKYLGEELEYQLAALERRTAALESQMLKGGA